MAEPERKAALVGMGFNCTKLGVTVFVQRSDITYEVHLAMSAICGMHFEVKVSYKCPECNLHHTVGIYSGV